VTSVLAVYAAAYVSATAESRRSDEFMADAEETRTQIGLRLETYVEVVRAGTALLAASNEIHHADFRAFVRRLALGERYPGLQGIGFSPRVAHADLREFFSAVELDGVEPLRIEPDGGRDEYQPVLFVEPAAAAAGRGFDLATDPVQREAMDRARDTGSPALSGRVSSGGPVALLAPNSVVLYAPVYRSGASTATVAQRRRALYGFVFSPLRPDVLLRHLETTARGVVAFEVRDRADSDAVLIRPAAASRRATAYESSGRLSIAGREWQVIVKAENEEPRLRPAAQNALFGGLLFSVMLFAITRIQIGAWETAERHAAELHQAAQALRAREAQLRDVLAREQAARTEAQEADRAKDDFLVGLSHELRTPLNAMLGWLTMLRTGTVREDRRAHALAVVERNARHQARLIEDLLDVSRILLGKIAVDLRPLDLAGVAAAAVESLRPSAAVRRIGVTIRQTSPSALIQGDAARVNQIVWNLVSNAIKFTNEGGSVAVELTDESSGVVLSVCDTGIGIAPEFLPHVFERFRQADTSTTRSTSGLGLGLAITRHLVELHGGSIEARSDGLGRGARFIVRFPVAPAVSDERLDESSFVRHQPLDRLRVLVVDDDRDTRELLAEALTASGARVMTADSAREAFDRLTREHADVLVSDIRMPDEDGISLLRRVRALPGEPGRIPAIALTAYARQHERAEAIRAGYQLHLAKPIELADLEASVARLAAESAGAGRMDASA
jgi:signal transduction histidine kinase/ActR/RegA family two-component response regulator